jgi:hypothetical protein
MRELCLFACFASLGCYARSQECPFEQLRPGLEKIALPKVVSPEPAFTRYEKLVEWTKLAKQMSQSDSRLAVVPKDLGIFFRPDQKVTRTQAGQLYSILDKAAQFELGQRQGGSGMSANNIKFINKKLNAELELKRQWQTHSNLPEGIRQILESLPDQPFDYTVGNCTTAADLINQIVRAYPD